MTVKNNFAINAMGLIIGNVAGQFISFATMPLVTRLYSPADFGLFSLFMSILSILGPLSTFRFNEAILLPKERHNVLNVFALSVASSFLFSLFVLFLITLIVDTSLIRSSSNINLYIDYCWLIPLGILLRGVFLSMNQLAEWQIKFKQLAFTPIIMNSTGRLIVISLGLFFYSGAWGLIAGRLSGLMICIIYFSWISLRGIFTEFKTAITVTNMGLMAKRYKEFALFGPWSVLLHTASLEILVFILVSVFSPTIAGLYALGKNMIGVPIRMIGMSLNRVFQQKAVRLKQNPSQLLTETGKFIKYLVYFILPIIFFLAVLGDWFFAFLFGNQWIEAGVYAQVLAPSFFFVFLYTCLRMFFIVLEKPRERLLVDLIYFVTRGSTILGVALYTHSPRFSLVALSISTSLFGLWFLTYIAKLLETDRFFFLKIILSSSWIILPFLVVVLLIRYYLLPNVALSFLALFSGLTLQLFFVLANDRFLLNQLIRIYKNRLSIK